VAADITTCCVLAHSGLFLKRFQREPDNIRYASNCVHYMFHFGNLCSNIKLEDINARVLVCCVVPGSPFEKCAFISLRMNHQLSAIQERHCLPAAFT